MKKIKIKKPCHEKWSKFTTTHTGAFCKTCAVNVIDFSTKSNDEIKRILVSNSTTKVCGRFTKTQLNDYNSTYHIWQNQNNPTFQSKFIFSLILGFGLTLFSCSTPQDKQTIQQLTTTIKAIEVSSIPTLLSTDTLMNSGTLVSSSIIPKHPKVKVQGPVVKKCPPATYLEGDFMMGDVIIIEEEIPTKGEINLEEIKMDEKTMTLGMITPPTLKTDSL